MLLQSFMGRKTLPEKKNLEALGSAPHIRKKTRFTGSQYNPMLMLIFKPPIHKFTAYICHNG